MSNHNPVLALTSDGVPHAWMSWEDAVVARVKNLIGWELGGESSIMGGTSRMTGERTHVEIAPIIALKGKFKYSRKAPALTNQLLFKRDQYHCSYCNRFTPESKLTRDHIVPVSKGGLDIWTNVVAACKRCNNSKDNKLLAATEMELIWIPYAPCKNEALILSNRKILFDQANFIKDFLPAHSRAKQFLATHHNFTF